MKKLRIALALVFGSIFTIAQAQNFDLGYVDLNFCNSQNQLHLQSTAGTQTGFCFVLNNLSNTTGTIKLSLVDGEMSVGENPVKACKTTSNWLFSKFITLSWAATGGLIVLPPNTWIVQRGTVNIPESFVGILNGCVAFTIDNGQGDWSGMFQIVNRKANIMDIVVSGDYVNMFGFINMKSYSGDKWKLDPSAQIIGSGGFILVTQSQWQNKLVIGLKNTGFINEEYVISGVISNDYFGKSLYTKSFVISSGALYGQDKLVIEYPLDELPWYKGKYSIDVQVTHNPIMMSWFEFDKDLWEVSFHETVSITTYPSRSVFFCIAGWVGIIGVIIVLVVILKRRKTQKKTSKKASSKKTK